MGVEVKVKVKVQVKVKVNGGCVQPQVNGIRNQNQGVGEALEVIMSHCHSHSLPLSLPLPLPLRPRVRQMQMQHAPPFTLAARLDALRFYQETRYLPAMIRRECVGLFKDYRSIGRLRLHGRSFLISFGLDWIGLDRIGCSCLSSSLPERRRGESNRVESRGQSQ